MKTENEILTLILNNNPQIKQVSIRNNGNYQFKKVIFGKPDVIPEKGIFPVSNQSTTVVKWSKK